MYLETAAGVTAYRLNRTTHWLEQLTPTQRQEALDLARRMYAKTTKFGRDNYLQSVEVKYQKRVDAIAVNKVKRRRLLKNMMKYDSVNVVLNTTQWDSFVTSVVTLYPDDNDKRDKALLKMMRLQFTCLRFRAGVRFGCLPRLSHNDNQHNVENVRAQYEIILKKFTNGTFDPVPVVRSVTDLLVD